MNAGWYDLPRDMVQAVGPDAQTFLQSQVSQDITKLSVGQSAWTFVLQPAGKVEVLARITRIGDADFVIDTDAGWGSALLARLKRFKIRVKLELEPVNWHCIAVRGPGSARVAVPEGCFAVACGWSGHEGIDIIGPAPSAPEGLEEINLFDADRLRIEAGWPAMGSEITEATIPGETGLVPLAVSFTKGCYPGQELVERIDSRGGNVPRRLRIIRGAGMFSTGDVIERDGDPVGTVTSVAMADDGWLALGYVSRTVDVPATLLCNGEAVTIEAAGMG
ncbi:MAG: folate-binding protein YgfZ [Acidimicrobiia bacterium]